MKKLAVKLIALLLVACVLIPTFASCDDENTDAPTSTTDNTTETGGDDSVSSDDSSNIEKTKYTVTWKNYDNTVLETDLDVEYGATPSYDGEDPVKDADAQYTYVFSGWDKTISAVTGDVTYVAQFSNITNKYTVTWNVDGNITTESYDYGATPSFKGNTDKVADAQYTYSFAGWDKTISPVTANVIYTARFSNAINKYTVTWKNHDGTVLETDIDVAYGTTPSYDGAEPTKNTTAQYTYTFSGWDKTISAVTGDITYTAQFSNTTNKYTVTWNVDGNVTTESYDYGATPSFKGNTDKAADDQYTYAFIGWDKTIASVTGDVTYTAQFSNTINKYTVTWNVDGNLTTESYDYGAVPSFKGNTDKVADAQYTYAFTGWDKTISTVTGDVTYTAQFSNTINKYTVTWKNHDGTVLETDAGVVYGATPSYDGTEPTKNATAQYTYSFIGWDKIVSSVTGDVTYTAQFSNTTNKYTITWKNYDGTVLETDTNVPYGTTPTYNGTVPTKTGTAQYNYSFNGWSPSIQAVSGNAEYTATFTTGINGYAVVWKNYDGSILETDTNVAYGTVPSYNGATPTKPATAQYTYTFSGWAPVVSSVVGYAEYVAEFTQTVNKYTVTWENHDGSVLETDTEVAYGTTPNYDGAEPTKVATAQYTYTFSGWDKTISTVTGNVTYTAQFSNTINTYTVTWKNYDGTVLETDTDMPYGTVPTYDNPEPQKQSTAQYTYVFNGWGETISAVTGNTQYTAQFTAAVNKYNVVWKNYDGSTLETDIDVPYGTMPSYNGATPTKSATAQYSYTFKGWDKSVSAVTGNVEYFAQFTQTVNKYTVTWKNYDGTVLETDANVEYGTTPSYNGATPTRSKTAQYTYTFDGWSPAINDVNGNVVYTAQYISTVNTYTITWKNYDGSVLETDTDVPYGTIPSYDGAEPTKNATAQYTYTFSGWDSNIGAVTGNVIYKAEYNSTVNRYTVTFKNYDGSVLATGTVDYGSNATYMGNTPTKSTEGNTKYVFSGWDKSYSNIVANIDVIAEYDVYTVYTFTYANGNSQTVDVIQGDSIGNHMPTNTAMAVTTNTETTYSWEELNAYEFKEKATVRYYYSVTYVLNGGDNHADNPTKVYSDTVYSLENATKVAYDFDGWYTDAALTNKLTSISNASSNITLYAGYHATSYTITYHLYDGDNAAKNPDTYTVEDEITFKDATKTGYTFQGWYSNAEMTTEVATISNKFGDFDLYAKFVPNEYKATFNDGVSVTLKASGYEDLIYYLNYGDTFDPYSEEVLQIYSNKIGLSFEELYFNGWYIDESLTNKLSLDKAITKNMTLYCKFSEVGGSKYILLSDMYKGFIKEVWSGSDSTFWVEYTIPKHCNGEICVAYSILNTSRYYERVFAYNQTQKKYLFDIEYTSSASYDYYSDYDEMFSAQGGDVIKVAVSKSPSYVVNILTYVDNSIILTASKTSETTVAYDSVFSVPSTVNERWGYTFKGWMDENGIYYDNAPWTSTENKVFTPQFELTNYKVYYELDGSTNNVNNPTNYNVLSDIILSSPVKPGYTFEGWYLDSEFLEPIETISNRTGNITLYALFSINSYTLTLDAVDGKYAPKIEFISDGNIIRTEYVFGDKIIEPFYPDAKEDYIFAGWHTDVECVNSFNFNTTLTEDIVLYAKWVENTTDTLNIETLKNPLTLAINGKNEHLMAFVPIADATITVTSTSDLDLIGILYDASKNVLNSADDIDDSNLNFSFTYTVEAGKLYYIAIRGNTVSTVGDAEINIDYVGNCSISGTTYLERTLTYVYGSEYTLPDNVEKEGYTFVGWFDDSNKQYVSGTWDYIENVSLHAVFEKNN